MSKQQGGSILAILIGVTLLFAASTNRIGDALNALRGKGSASPSPKLSDGDAPDSGEVPGTGESLGMHSNGKIQPVQNGSVRRES